MAAPRRAPVRDDFATVDRGWDPDEVRAAIGRLTRELSILEGRLESAEARVPAGAAEAAGKMRDAVLAEAQHRADEVRGRALTDARRLRSRAAEEGREITLQARRDALELVKTAREGADQIVSSARDQEASLHGRVRKLQVVVRRTEGLLRDVASADLGNVAVDSGSPARAGEGGIGVVVAAEQARVARRLQGVPDPRSEGIPDSVQRLLNALKNGTL